MASEDKWALFDFCETLVNFQTADAYVKFAVSKADLKLPVLYTVGYRILTFPLIRRTIQKLLPNSSINKRLVLRKLKGLSLREASTLAREYYEECIKPNFITDTLRRMTDLQKDGYKIMIVSGGYDLYLEHFCKDFKIDALICTKLGVKDGVLTGRFDGIDCLRANKISLLERHPLYKAICDSYSISFSDSITDLPLLKWSTDGVVVSHLTHQKWVDEYKLKEIIWS